MRYKLLGKSGLRVSELCLGTMTFMDGLSWGAAKPACQAIFDAFVEAGGNFVDTSNSYGTSEPYLGEFMAGDRDRIVIATKYGGSLPSQNVNSSGNHRKSLIGSVEASLRHLRTDYIDLLWLNAWDEMTPIAETMRALDDLVRQGKLLYVGIANAPAWFVARANTLAEERGLSPFIGVQVEYNLVERTAERELLPMAHALDIGVVAWTPLASGWLTGKYGQPGPAAARRLDDPIAARFVQRSERNMQIVAEVCAIAAERGCTPAHVALNWLRARRVIPILGARSAAQLNENMECLDSRLVEADLRRLHEVSKIALGFPHDFLASGMVKQHIYGGRFQQIDNHHENC